MNSERRRPTPQEKIAALKRHLLEGIPVSTIWDELGIAPTVFYRWQKEHFENGHTLFEIGRAAKAVEDAKDEKIQKLEAKLQRKNEVLAELMEAHTQLEKDLGRATLPWPVSVLGPRPSLAMMISIANDRWHPYAQQQPSPIPSSFAMHW